MYENSGPNGVRKNKILGFIEKDIFVLNNYETAAFKNKNHAIECLIPYHIFQLTADDIKFRGSDVEIDFKKEINMMKSKLLNMIEEHTFEEECFTPQLLLYHEQKYLNSLAKQTAPPKKKKTSMNLRIRIPRTKIYYVYGNSRKLRISRHSQTD
jgi:hypothetical protein